MVKGDRFGQGACYKIASSSLSSHEDVGRYGSPNHQPASQDTDSKIGYDNNESVLQVLVHFLRRLQSQPGSESSFLVSRSENKSSAELSAGRAFV